MFVQTEITPNPNSLKFLPGKIVSSSGSFEVTKKDETSNELVRNLLSINGVEGIFLGRDFISINKYDDFEWDEIKHVIISLINDFYSSGKECVIIDLTSCFRLAPLCFLGQSLFETGQGQSPYQAAAWGAAIIVGPFAGAQMAD